MSLTTEDTEDWGEILAPPLGQKRIMKLAYRDGWECAYCGKETCVDGKNGPKATVDHKIPKSKGGPDTLLNCVVACDECNKAKADQLDWSPPKVDTEVATPETDGSERMAFAGEYMVPTEVARRLERERDEARSLTEHQWLLKVGIRLFEAGCKSDGILDSIDEVIRERDEARAWAEKLQTVAMQHSIRAEKAERERDEAREEARIAIGLLSTHPQFAKFHPEEVWEMVKLEAAK